MLPALPPSSFGGIISHNSSTLIPTVTISIGTTTAAVTTNIYAIIFHTMLAVRVASPK